ncbi:glyceraldehyde-3-phosphate dehydrogenase [Caudoviricetes sp.]|nr:glyceraldehyde-3-phosphate dehydrogenase [Caudoviricetes sp.]
MIIIIDNAVNLIAWQDFGFSCRARTVLRALNFLRLSV